jgi:TolA-binding protein
MGRGIGPSRIWAAALAALLWGTSLWGLSVAQATEPRAVERFRAAAALQQRSLYDLAESEYSAIAKESPSDPIAARARLQRGVCLFQLGRFADARSELAGLHTSPLTFSPGEIEQYHAYLGLAAYNLSHDAQGGERDQLLDAAIDSLNHQLEQFPSGALAEQTAFYRAEALYDRGRLDLAAEAYTSVLKKYPQHSQRAETLYALGVAQQELGRLDGAARTFAQFATEFPQHSLAADADRRRGDVLLAVAEEQLAGQQPQAARQAIEHLLAEYPESAFLPRALLDLARTQVAQSEPQAAEASLDQCLQRCTEHAVAIEARLLRAQLRHARGDFAGSLTDVSEVLTDDPQRPEALHVRGLCELGLNRPSDAVNTLTAIAKNNPKIPQLDRVLYDLAWAYEQSGQHEQATATFAQLAELHPDSQFAAESHFRVGESQYAAKDFIAAAKNYTQAYKCSPSRELLDTVLHKLAWCCFERRQFGAAEEAFDRQIALQHERIEAAGGKVDESTPLEPLAADALWMIVECRFQQQQFASALKLYDVAVGQRSAGEPLRAMVSLHAVQSAEATKQWERAVQIADRALRDYPATEWAVDTRSERGLALVELGRLDDAEQELAAIAAAEPGVLQVKSEFGLGKILVARKQYDEAVRMFFKAAYGHGGPTAPEPYRRWQAEAVYAAAQVLGDTQRPEPARKLYQEIIDNYPNSTRASLSRQALGAPLRR